MQQQPVLAAPGAGLPLHQRMFLKYYMGPFVAARADWQEDDKYFVLINEKILKCVEAVPQELWQTPVLVPRQKGLEDSSRFWSLAMTLEHITFVGKNIVDITNQLSRGRVPPKQVRIQDVKPKGQKPAAQVLDEFKSFLGWAPAELAEKVVDKDSLTTLVHPWFGPFTARQWHWLLGAHSNIHLRQLREIVKGLPR